VSERTDLEAAATVFLDQLPESRAEAMAFCYGYLDQVVKGFINGSFTLSDLTHSRELLNTVLDLHRDRR